MRKGGRFIEGGGGLHLLLAVVIWPLTTLTTHPFKRSTVSTENSDTANIYALFTLFLRFFYILHKHSQLECIFIFYNKHCLLTLCPSCFFVSGHNLSLRIAIVYSLPSLSTNLLHVTSVRLSHPLLEYIPGFLVYFTFPYCESYFVLLYHTSKYFCASMSSSSWLVVYLFVLSVRSRSPLYTKSIFQLFRIGHYSAVYVLFLMSSFNPRYISVFFASFTLFFSASLSRSPIPLFTPVLYRPIFSMNGTSSWSPPNPRIFSRLRHPALLQRAILLFCLLLQPYQLWPTTLFLAYSFLYIAIATSSPLELF